MRWLVVADLHYSLPQYDWVMEVAGNFDVVIIAGDHLDTSSLVDLRGAEHRRPEIYRPPQGQDAADHLLGQPRPRFARRSGEKVARWISDLHSQGVPTDGDSVVIDETLVTICPWWDGPVVREEIGALLAADAGKRGDRWIWIHHAPPASSPTSWDGKRYYGDVELERWIAEYKPDFVFSGHVHQSPFSPGGSWVDRIGETWVFNAGHQFGAPPAHVVLDTDREMALWFSAAGNQYVRLDEPLQRPVAKLYGLPDWLTSADRTGDPIPA